MTDRTGPGSPPPTASPSTPAPTTPAAPGAPTAPAPGAPAATPPSADAGSPFRLNLEQQKNRAKDLLRAAKAGEPEALARLARSGKAPDAPSARAPSPSAAVTSRPAGDTAPKLADAQFAIARELRFPSWAKLKAHIASMEGQRAAIERKQPPPDADLKTLHLRCGHDIQKPLVEAGFVGSFHAHITPYCQGPVTAGPDRHERMARFIVDGFDNEIYSAPALVYEDVLEAERAQEDFLLRSADDYERVVIWMEYDNWDQLILLRLLAHYADAKRPRALELVNIDEFPGGKRFLGIGELPPEALRLLWSTRRPVTESQLDLGREGWQALTSADPRRLAAIARSGTPALPIMATALLRHLRELPAIASGLSAHEERILKIIAEEGVVTVNKLFWTLQAREAQYLLSDAAVASMVSAMEHAGEPPLVRSVGTPGERGFRNQLTLTDAGRAVLAGERDWQSLKPPPRWVGAVHVVPGTPGWRWDEAKREPVWFGGV